MPQLFAYGESRFRVPNLRITLVQVVILAAGQQARLVGAEYGPPDRTFVGKWRTGGHTGVLVANMDRFSREDDELKVAWSKEAIGDMMIIHEPELRTFARGQIPKGGGIRAPTDET